MGRRARLAWLLLVLFAALAAPAFGAAATFTVNSTTDTDDGTCDALHCSLREAINAANQGSAADTIAFDIPPGGVQTIMPTSSLPAISFPVTIDGTTQPGFAGTPVVELNGSIDGANGLRLNLVTGTTVRGLVINRFSSAAILIERGGGNVIEGNFIGTDPTGTVALPNGIGISVQRSQSNTIGGTTAAARNLVSGNSIFGIFIDEGGGNVIQGNRVGTNASGSAVLGAQDLGVAVVNSPNALIGGTAAGAGNLVSGNSEGIRVESASSTGAVVQGNFVGTDATGTVALGNEKGLLVFNAPGVLVGGTASGARNLVSGNSQLGMWLIRSAGGPPSLGALVQGNLIGTDVSGTAAVPNQAGVVLQGTGITIGGTTPEARNVISGNSQGGVTFSDETATGNVVQGNFIGVDVNGAPLGNQGPGVLIQNGATGNTLGGTTAGAGNVIAFNRPEGVRVLSGTRNAILGNSIFSNSSLGIDLFPFGVTPNDPGDGDTGANELQNFPVITSAVTAGGSTTVSGTLNSKPNTTYRLEFFANGACDPSGHGEGEEFIGAGDVTTDASGNAAFTFSFPAGDGNVITSTATDPVGNTSEFSQCGAAVLVATLVLEPKAAVNPVGTMHTVTATVRDTLGQPVAGITVRFVVIGSVTASGSCVTAANGQCSFSYTGPPAPGADLIRAFADTDQDGAQDAGEPFDTATKAWVLVSTVPGLVTGGGHILDPAASPEEIAFGFNAHSTADEGTFGHCNVVDHAGNHVKCLDVLVLVQTATHATFSGNATVNGVPTTYTIDVDDLCESGAGCDTFKITAGSFVAAGTLTSGNIQIHPPS
jgi:CSLREA domain-containing protein